MTNDDSIEAFSKECEELEKAATPVVAWYTHPYEKGHIRGPYHRWLEVLEPKEELIENGKIKRAHFEADVKFVAMAMNSEPFWRKLAMKYRAGINDCLNSDSYDDCECICLELIALTKKDIEDLE